ncbi:MAG TPA: DUF4143 domain-containing protein, partial [Thermoanaerobaculia bacterium]|nr:DUF4143 domain-containing protein [Thermoanaerobaculia bacterium]
RSWLGVLEASFIAAVVPAWHRNVRKQVIKTPKLHFIDTGVICSVLGIRDADQLRTHPLRGALFESWVAGEILKALLHRGVQPDLTHYREARGTEIDLIVRRGGALHLVECKSGATAHPSFFEPLSAVRELLDETEPSVTAALVYGGAESYVRRTIPLYGWADVDRLCRRVAG